MDFKKAIDNLEKNNQKVVLFFFIAFLLTGIFIFKDFGISWDEHYQWKSNGHVNYNFIVHNDQEPLLNGADKYHGPAFELVLVVAEKLFRLTDVRDIFLMRHFLCFLVFYISALFFYFLSLRFFKSRRLALLGFLMYVLSPHIFSHAFYNSKDTVFLAFFTISIFYLFYFLEKKTVFRAALFAIVTAFTIDVRIVAVIIPALFVYLNFMPQPSSMADSLRNKAFGKTKWIFLFFMILVPFIILFWPVLWLDPLFHFKEALKENSHYPWEAPVLYFGEEYKPTTLPWHYLFFWMFVSRPVLYSVFFISGFLTILWRIVSKPINFITQKKEEQTAIFWFFFPLLAMFIFKSPAFDTGRHLYFLHGAFVLISVYGVQAISQVIKSRKAAVYVFIVAIGVSLTSVLWSMIRLHPYEHLYFNETQMRDMNERKSNFEFDYWGLASKESLVHLLEIDSSKQIIVQAENLPGELNAYLLPAKERARIKFTKDMKGAQYYIADYRWTKAENYPYKTEVYSKMVGNAKVSTVFKVWDPEELYKKIKGKTLLSSEQNFEETKNEWTQNQIIKMEQGAHSGKGVTRVDSVVEYSDTFVLTDLSALLGNKTNVVKASFWLYDVEVGSNSKFVFSLETKEGNLYFWQAIREMKNEVKLEHPEWKQITGALELPLMTRKDDKIKIYLWNIGKKKVLMDDVKIEFVEELLK